MAFHQNDTTKKFVKSVKTLIDTGQVRSMKEISIKLDYNYTALSQIISGTRNVPAHVNAEFINIYKPVELMPMDSGVNTLYNQAIGRVLLRGMAELLSKQRGESMIRTLGDLEAAVKAEIRNLEIK